MRIRATRRVQFAIGHRVMGHEGKCRHMHGHNFVFFLTAERNQDLQDLDAVGRVVDFGVLKERVGEWIERNWDHGFVVATQDDEAVHAMGCVEEQKYFLLPYNPTAENLARFLLTDVGPLALVGTGVHLVKVTVHETENGIAEAELP